MELGGEEEGGGGGEKWGGGEEEKGESFGHFGESPEKCVSVCVLWWWRVLQG